MTDQPLEKINLMTEEARHFTRDLLGWDDPLSHALSVLPLEEGAFSAFLPRDLKLKSAADFQWANRGLEGRRDEIFNRVVDFVADHLSSSKSAVVLFASAWQRGDSVLERLKTPYVFLPGEGPLKICHFLDASKWSSDMIAVALEEGRAFSSVASLSFYGEGIFALRGSQVLTGEQVQHLAQNTRHLLLEAFDGMGYVIWSKIEDRRDHIGDTTR